MDYSFDELRQINLDAFFELMLIEIEQTPDYGNQNMTRKATQSDIDSFLS